MASWHDYIRDRVPVLAAAGVPDPAEDLAQLAAYVLQVRPSAVDWQSEATPEQLAAIEVLAQRRAAREPIERIMGESWFMGLRLRVTPEVFRPCAETVATVDHALQALHDKTGPVRILDLGTGSGCILLGLLKELPWATGVGVDCDAAAVELARENAAANNLQDRAVFQQGDWTNNIDGPFDLIIGNPPRIPTALVPHLIREVTLYDPLHSLDGGRNGADFFVRTARDFRRLAAAGGICVLQVGERVAVRALRIFQAHGFSQARLERDYKAAVNCVVARNEVWHVGWIAKIGGWVRQLFNFIIFRHPGKSRDP